MRMNLGIGCQPSHLSRINWEKLLSGLLQADERYDLFIVLAPLQSGKNVILSLVLIGVLFLY
ncbi:MAG: hypothetical protein IPK94_08475 [Saprospiraceae bacterium]|nr:hypothetical protein [Saprospiraceae bacterium]